MQKARLTRLVWLVVLAALLASCGTMASPPTPSPTQPPPTLTPIPPTETPVPTDTPTSVPTDTTTPVPTQSLSLMIEIFTAVTKGDGVPDAAAYDPQKLGIHPVIIISPSKELEQWNSNLPVSWRPSNVSQTELVAQTFYQEVIIETECRRSGFISGCFVLTRVRYDTIIILREARTGTTVTTTVFQGGNPPPILDGTPQNMQKMRGYYNGTKVAYDTVELWLREFIEK